MFWIFGGFAHGETRIAWWALALLIASSILAGLACHLTGTALFKWGTNARPTPPLWHMAGLVLLGLLGLLALAVVPLHLTPLMAGGGATAVLATVALWGSIALCRA